MYEAKYSKYITKSSARFATEDEIKESTVRITRDSRGGGCGAVMYYEDGALYVDDSDAHIYVQGGTGSKKTRTEGISIIKSIMKAGENILVNDPKGELYRNTAGYARSCGYNVKVLNFRDVSRSNGWNPLSLSRVFEAKGDSAAADEAVSDLKTAIIAPSRQKTADRYWVDMAGEVIKYCTMLLKASVPDECYNIANVIQLTHECNATRLSTLLVDMDQNTSVATSMHGVLDLVSEKTSSCVYSVVKQSLIPFYENKALLELLCCNDICFDELVDKKTAIYVIYPDEKTTLSFMVNLFFTQCYQYLVSRSAEYSDNMLPRRVNFVFDEFSNLPPIESFENRISEARGHNIRYFLFGQSFGQLKCKYGDNAETIVANCDWIIFPSKDIRFFEDVSKMCGRELDYNGREHDLISACEIMHLKKFKDGAEALILKNGQYPFVTKIPDYQYIDVFDSCPPAEFSEVQRHSTPVFLSFDEWYHGLGRIYSRPYPKYVRPKAPAAQKPIDGERLEDVQKLLQRKFEEMFGTLPTDE